MEGSPKSIEVKRVKRRAGIFDEKGVAERGEDEAERGKNKGVLSETRC